MRRLSTSGTEHATHGSTSVRNAAAAAAAANALSASAASGGNGNGHGNGNGNNTGGEKQHSNSDNVVMTIFSTVIVTIVARSHSHEGIRSHH